MFNFLKIEINSSRIYGLDILRAFAILFVVLDHSKHTLQNSNSEIISGISQSYSWYIRYLVFDGVSIFFVLSGFLIGSILIKTFDRGDLSFKSLVNFWIKRWMRTLPNYLFILSLLILLSTIYSKNFNFQDAMPYYFFIQNFSSPHPGFFPEAWSLSVEEWFYLLIPSAILSFSLILRSSFKKILILIAFFVLISSTMIRYYYDYNGLVSSHEAWSLLLRKQVITRLDSLMYGLIGAYFFYFKNEVWCRYSRYLFLAGILMLVLDKYIILFHPNLSYLYKNVFSFSVTSLAVLFLLPLFESIRYGEGFLYSILTYISIISYSMYLLNLSMMQDWIFRPLPFFIHNPTILAISKFILYWLLTFFLSFVMYKLIELPFMNMRRYLTIK